MKNSGQAFAKVRKAVFGLSLLGLRKVIIIVAALSLLILIALLFYQPKRSFLLEAETRSVELTFLPGANTWRFARAVICVPLTVPRLQPDAFCGLASEALSDPRELIVAWDEGMRIAMTSSPGNGISIEVLASDRADLPLGSVIRVKAEDTSEIGALTFAATAVLGQEMTTGRQSYLIGGHWEARESGLVISAFRSLTEIVKSGPLTTGTRVEVLNSGMPARTYGFVVIGHNADSPAGLHVSVLSEAGDTALSVRHFGLDRPVVIEPDWMDLTLSSPLILSLGVLLAMLAAISQIISDAPSIRRKPEDDDK